MSQRRGSEIGELQGLERFVLVVDIEALEMGIGEGFKGGDIDEEKEEEGEKGEGAYQGRERRGKWWFRHGRRRREGERERKRAEKMVAMAEREGRPRTVTDGGVRISNLHAKREPKKR